jgi:hypothetical protein
MKNGNMEEMPLDKVTGFDLAIVNEESAEGAGSREERFQSVIFPHPLSFVGEAHYGLYNKIFCAIVES